MKLITTNADTHSNHDKFLFRCFITTSVFLRKITLKSNLRLLRNRYQHQKNVDMTNYRIAVLGGSINKIIVKKCFIQVVLPQNNQFFSDE